RRNLIFRPATGTCKLSTQDMGNTEVILFDDSTSQCDFTLCVGIEPCGHVGQTSGSSSCQSDKQFDL
ncbi:hypothetical protein Bpfe_029444, partial [Biomphalaria pfeifferi]